MSLLEGLAQSFQGGGNFMWVILAGMIVIVALIVERSVYLLKSSVDKDKLLALLKSQVMSGNVQGAIKVCSGNPTPITRIVQAGLMKFNKSDQEVQAAMDEAALREIPKLQKRTPYLAMMANFTIMAGLLGTIVGMIKAFRGVAGADAARKATELAEGISMALNCTAWGIAGCLAGLVGYALLTGKTNNLVNDINEVTVQVVNLVTQHRAQMQQPAGV